MNKALISKKVFLARCVMFEDNIEGSLVRKKLDINDEFRMVFCYRGRVIDFETAEELPLLPHNIIYPNTHIDTNTYYLTSLSKCTQLTDKEIKYIPSLLRRYQEKHNIEQKRKIIQFPTDRIKR